MLLAIVLFVLLVFMGILVWQLIETKRKEWRITVRYFYKKDNLAKRFTTETVSDRQLTEEYKRLDGLFYPYRSVNARRPRQVLRFTEGFKYSWVDKDKHPFIYMFNKLEGHKLGRPFQKYWVDEYGEMNLRFYLLASMMYKPIAILQYYYIEWQIKLQWWWYNTIHLQPNRHLDSFKSSKMHWIKEVLSYRELCAPLAKRHDGLMYWGGLLKEDWMFFVSKDRSGDLVREANYIAVTKMIEERVEANPDLEHQWDTEHFNGNYYPDHIILKVFDYDWKDPQRLKPLPLAVWAVEEIQPRLDDYAHLDEELYTSMESMEEYDMIWEYGRGVIDTDKMPEGTDWGKEELFYTGEEDLYPNDQERPYWVYSLLSILNEVGYDAPYESGDVQECIYRLGWMQDYDMEDFEWDTDVGMLVLKSDPEDYEYTDRKFSWTSYFPENELISTGDGKYYSPEYFETHIQPPLPLVY